MLTLVAQQSKAIALLSARDRHQVIVKRRSMNKVFQHKTSNHNKSVFKAHSFIYS